MLQVLWCFLLVTPELGETLLCTCLHEAFADFYCGFLFPPDSVRQLKPLYPGRQTEWQTAPQHVHPIFHHLSDQSEELVQSLSTEMPLKQLLLLSFGIFLYVENCCSFQCWDSSDSSAIYIFLFQVQAQGVPTCPPPWNIQFAFSPAFATVAAAKLQFPVVSFQ